MKNEKTNETTQQKACCRKTVRPAEEKKKLMYRLNRIEGQVRGIKRMLENDTYCEDILVQSAAVNAAINGFNREILASHIKGCITDDIRAGKEESVDELIKTIHRLMR